ncbi:MAG: zinc protease [Marinoscillum sp.]|jgi:zinc protease
MLDRSVAPAASTITRPTFPTVERINVGDVEMNILNLGEQPVVLFEMVFPVGRWEEPAPGLAFMLFKMIQEGTEKHNSEEIAELLDHHGSYLEITPTLDNVSIKLYTLNRFFPKLISLLAEMLSIPNFPEKEIITLKSIRLEQIKQSHARNNAYANLVFREMLYGKNHPYGQLIEAEMVDLITKESLLEARKLLSYKPTVFITGMITKEEIEEVNKAFKEIKFIDAPSRRSVDFEQTPSKNLIREDTTQASIRIGCHSINRNHADIHHFKVANELLGGFFGSRLMKNIREEKGLTYGIHSGMLHLSEGSYWSVSSEVLKDKMSLAQHEITREIERLQNEPPSAEEFAMVINYLKGKFLSSFGSPFSTHDMIKGHILAGLPEGYFDEFLNTLDTMKPHHVNEVLRKHINVESFTSLEVY